MFDIGWSELLLIGGVALVVIGPKDLPRALRTLGQTTTKVRRMAADFQRQFNEAMREADMEEFRKGVSDVVDTARDLKNNFNPIDRLRNEIKGAIDDSGAQKPLPTDMPSAGDYLTSMPEAPDPDAAGKAIAAETTPVSSAASAASSSSTPMSGSASNSETAPPKTPLQGGTKTDVAAQTPDAPPARKRRVARTMPPGIAGDDVAEAGPAAKPARARRQAASRAAKMPALPPADARPALPAPEAMSAEAVKPARTRRKGAAADATLSASAPKKRAPRKKAVSVADAAGAVAPEAAPDVSPAVAPDAIAPAIKPASDGTS